MDGKAHGDDAVHDADDDGPTAPAAGQTLKDTRASSATPCAGAACGFYCQPDAGNLAHGGSRVTDALKAEGFGALTAQPNIGLLLAGNVIVREDDDGSFTAGFMDPVALMQMTDDPEVARAPLHCRHAVPA